MRDPPGQPIEPVDCNCVDLAASDLDEKFLEGRAIETRAGIAQIVELLLNDLKPLATAKSAHNSRCTWQEVKSDSVLTDWRV